MTNARRYKMTKEEQMLVGKKVEEAMADIRSGKVKTYTLEEVLERLDIKNGRAAAKSHSISLSNETGFIASKTDGLYMKKYRASFEVKVGKDGGLYVSNMEQGIFTDGMTREELVKNIHEAVECHFDIPSYKDVDINIKYT